MGATHGPAPEDDEGEDGASDDGAVDEEEAVQEPTMDIETLFELLDAQAGSLHCAIRSAQEVAEPGEELPLEHTNSIKTELIEIQAAVEGLLTEHSSAATPWEYAGEHVPDEHLDDFLR